MSEESFETELRDKGTISRSGKLNLNIEQMPSAQSLKELLEGSNTFKLYKTQEVSKGLVYAGTMFEYKSMKSNAYVIVDANNVEKAKIQVMGKKKQFIDSIYASLLNIICKS